MKISQEKLAPVVRSVQEFYRRETGDVYSKEVVETAFYKWLEARFESEDLKELLTTPHLDEAKAFREILEETAAPASESEENLFNGFRKYSPEKMAAMIWHFAAKGKQMYKTKLNKLLFYADFVNFYLNGRSISGANYVHLPFGPVPDQYEQILKKLTAAGELEMTAIKTRKGTASEIHPGANAGSAAEKLAPEEAAALDWVLDNYGEMSTEEIMELSHNEKAYRNTYPNEKIAYGYAQFLEILPEKKK